MGRVVRPEAACTGLTNGLKGLQLRTPIFQSSGELPIYDGKNYFTIYLTIYPVMLTRTLDTRRRTWVSRPK